MINNRSSGLVINISIEYSLNEKLPVWTKSYGTVPKYKTLHKSGYTNTNILKIYLLLINTKILVTIKIVI